MRHVLILESQALRLGIRVLCLGLASAVVVAGEPAQPSPIDPAFSARLVRPACVPPPVWPPDGWVDPTFDPTGEGEFVGPADGRASVTAIVVQPNGRTIVAGNFSAYNGTPCARLARLNPDRTQDNTFKPGRIDRAVQAVALQADGRILVGGTFSTLDVCPRSGLARLNPDGTIDAGFQADVQGPNVGLLRTETDGRIWVGGNFSTVAGTPRRNLTRLNAEGTVDLSFMPPDTIGGACDYVSWVQSLQDGRVLVGGHFEGQRSQLGADQNLVRLHPDGRLDGTFTSDLSGLYLATAVVRPDGRIVAGGLLHSWTGGSHSFALAELDPDGRVLREVPARDLPAMVTSIVLEPDNRLVIGGMFATLYGAPRNGLGRLSVDGTLDAGFDPGEVFAAPLEPAILTLARQDDGRLWVGAEHAGGREATQALALLEPDGRAAPGIAPRLLGTGGVITALGQDAGGGVFVGGHFTSFNNQPRTHLARLNPDGSLDPSFLPVINPNLSVGVLLRQPDGKLLVAGRTDPSAAGPPLIGLVRLDPDGSSDAGFSVAPNTDGDLGLVRCLALQGDGKILIGGEFNLPPRGLARLNTDGRVDPGFVPPDLPAWDEEGVHAVAVLADGRILIGGQFGCGADGLGAGLARLNPNGSLDRSYDLGARWRGSAKTIVAAPAGKWLVGGVWTDAGGAIGAHLLRLDAQGELDGVIRVEQPIQSWPLAIEADGHLLAGGPTLVRISPEGVIDPRFTLRLGGSGDINALLIQADGRILIGGDFNRVNGRLANNLARLYPAGWPRAPFAERQVGPPSRVKLVVRPPAGTRRYSVEDQPSWKPVGGVSSGGRYDPATGTVTFGPFSDDQPRELEYHILIPPGGAGQIQFHGSATADGITTPIVGDTSLCVWPFPPPPLWLEIRHRPLSQGLVLQIWSLGEGILEIDVSADLRAWDTLATLTDSTGFIEFADPVPAAASRFFRVRQR